MRKFNTIVDGASYRSLQIGTTVPSGAVNLAYVDAPELSSDCDMQIFDYSQAIPANNQPIGNLQVDMYTGDSHMLARQDGVALYTVRGIMVTDEYYTTDDPDSAPTPLFYKYAARYPHYESGINASETHQYTGHNIVVTENGIPTSQPHVIYITPLGNNIFTMTLYTSFLCDAQHTYELCYNKYIDSKQYPTHKETLNSAPAYTENSDKSAVLASNPETQIFHVADAPDYAGHYVYVPDVPTVVPRTPLLFRWRVTRSDGIKSRWHVEYIYQKKSMLASDYKNNDGGMIYSDDTISDVVVAKKLLTKSPAFLFSQYKLLRTYSMSIDTDIQIWHDGQWVNNDAIGGTHAVLIAKTPAFLTAFFYAWVNPDNAGIDTGEAGDQSSVVHYEYPEHTLGYTISGKSSFTGTQYIPGKKVNHAASHNRATAVWSNYASFSNVYEEITSPSLTIDGAQLLNSSFFSTGGSLWGRTKQNSGSMPAHADPVFVINFTAAATVDTIEVVLGRVGRLKKVELLNNTTVVWTANTPFGDVSIRDEPYQKIVTISTGTVSNVNKLRVTIGADERKAVDYWWLLNLFGIKDKYVGEFMIQEVTAIENVPPQNVTDPIQEWHEERYVEVAVAKNRKYDIQLRKLIQAFGLTPPQNLVGNCSYTITPGIPGVADSHPSCNITLCDALGRPIADGENSLTCSYATAMSVLSPIRVSASTDSHTLMKSKKFTVRNSVEPSIFVDKPVDQGPDEMWGLYVNNGRFAIVNGATKLVRHFFMPEFGMQPFSPKLPYMQQIDEEAEFIDDKIIKVRYAPLYVTTANGEPNNISVTVNGANIAIVDWNSATGYLHLGTPIRFTDTALATYQYEQKYVVYRGYGDADTHKFYHLDLNPLAGHQYTDLATGQEQASSILLTKDVYLYIVPAYTFYSDSSGDSTVAASSVLRHIIVDEGTTYANVAAMLPQDAFVLACVTIRAGKVPSDAVVIDTRTRGGGLIDGLSSEVIAKIGIDGSSCMFDVGSWDGELYPCNGVIVVTLPQSILVEHGGTFTEQDVHEALARCVAFGVYPIVRYI